MVPSLDVRAQVVSICDRIFKLASLGEQLFDLTCS